MFVSSKTTPLLTNARSFAFGAAALFVTMQPANADNVFSTLMAGGLTDASNWEVTLGGGALYAPKYEGSDKHELKALPFVEVIWNDTLFLSPMDGLGANIVSYHGFTAGASIGYDGGREEKDSRSELRGMGKIDGGVTGTGFVEYDLQIAKANASVTKYFAGSEGVTAEFGISTFLPLSVLFGDATFGGGYSESEEGAKSGHGLPGPALTLGVSAEWADDKYMRDYFGVSAAQSANSGKAAFNAGAGFKSVSAEAGLLVPVTENVMIGSMVTYERLIGDAADSPLSVNDDQLSGMLFTTYTF